MRRRTTALQVQLAVGKSSALTMRVGDRYACDMIGAHEAGLFTVLLDVHEIPIRDGVPQPDAVVSDVADVLGVLPLV